MDRRRAASPQPADALLALKAFRRRVPIRLVTRRWSDFFEALQAALFRHDVE